MTQSLSWSSPKVQPPFLDRALDYLSATAGATDLLKALNYSAQALRYLPLGSGRLSDLGKLAAGVDLAGSSLWITSFIPDLNTLRKTALNSGRLKDLTYQGCTVAAEGIEVLSFLGKCLGRALPLPVSAGGTLCWTVTDSMDFVSEIQAFRRNSVQLHVEKRSVRRRALKDNLKLSQLKLVKTVASLGMDGIAVVSLVVLLACKVSLTVTAAYLLLSIAYLVANVAIHFFKQRMTPLSCLR